MKFDISGQFLYFSLVSTLSGTAVTGSSGFISGRRCTDGGSMTVLSGNVVEDAGGLYHANLYDWDTSGSYIGYLFTASGCVPVSFSVETDLTASGRQYLSSGQAVSVNSGQLSGQPITLLSGRSYIASGMNTVVPIASISGVTIISGANVIVPPATLSGIVANSGLFVSVPIATISGVNSVASVTSITSGLLSGQLVTLVSGQSYTASGIFTTASVSISSGTIYLASGQAVSLNSGQSVLLYSGQTQAFLASGSLNIFVFASGVIGASGNLPQAWGNSGSVSVGQNLDKTGYVLTSGLSYPASGVFTVASVSITSGQVYIASGTQVVTAVNQDKSGYTVGTNLDKVGYGVTSISSGLLSGQLVTLVSGQSYTASGIWASVPSTSVSSGSLYLASGSIFLNTFASGVVGGGSGNFPSSWGNSGAVTVGQNLDKLGYILTSGLSYPASGIFVVVLPASISGLNAVVPPASLSGVVANSGLFVNANVSITPASLSGVNAIVPPTSLSGVMVNSGLFVTVPISTLSGLTPISGASVIVPTASISGVNSIAASGVNAIVPTASLSGLVVNSGLFVSVPTVSISGVNSIASVTSISSGLLSGQQVTLTSGQSYTASGIWPASGASVIATVSVASGQVYLASGQLVGLLSGQSVQVYSGQLSGQPIAGLSGFTYPASGQTYPASGSIVVIPPTSLSGVTVSVPINTISGVNIVAPASSGTVYLPSGSIFTNTFASGVITQDIPYGILEVDMSGVTGEAVHSPVNALRKLTNKWSTTVNSGFLTVFKEDAITTAYTQALTSQSGAAPITQMGDS